MSKLSDIKASFKELELLGLPISNEQRQHLVEAEDEYIKEEIIPQIKKLLNDIFDDIDIKVRIAIEYDGNNNDDIKVYLQDDGNAQHPVMTVSHKKHRTRQGRGKKLYLRLTFPDGHQETGKGVDILRKVVNKVGPKQISESGIRTRGILLVEDHYVDKVAHYQKPIEGGYYLMVNSSNQQKKKKIEEISRLFQLHYKVDIVDEHGNIQN